MPKSKKKFIDKKSAVTFHLVHRSQQDPLVTDETAPQHVLVESETVQKKVEDSTNRKKELIKFGVFFDDDYDYLQHLREPEDREVHWEYVEPTNIKNSEDTKHNIQLPSSVFASAFEEDEGLLRKAAPRSGPRPDWDPDVVAAMDDDFDHDDPENELEDDFFQQAMTEGDGADDHNSNDEEYSDIDSEFSDDEERDALGPLRQYENEELKSRFTEYSMSSSVIRRNEQLALLDERFEKFFEKYDEPEIGALDCEEIEGEVEINDNLLMQCLVEFKRDEDLEEYNKEWDVLRIKKLQEDGSSDEDMVEMEVEDERKKKWDCESVLSTYSNLYNHPKVIDEPRRRSKIAINPKTGVPLNVFNGENKQLTTKSLARFDIENSTSPANTTGPKSLCAQSVLSTLSVLSLRPKDETLEEKRERKHLLKEYRQERRIERKANTIAFKEEKKVQDKISINKRNNLQGNRIV